MMVIHIFKDTIKMIPISKQMTFVAFISRIIHESSFIFSPYEDLKSHPIF
jgi:hypothetical protein